MKRFCWHPSRDAARDCRCPRPTNRSCADRLTFGRRPGDVEEVRKTGVENWIELQLHPERIAENPVLDAKLKPFETLRMEPAEILKEYSPQRMTPVCGRD